MNSQCDIMDGWLPAECLSFLLSEAGEVMEAATTSKSDAQIEEKAFTSPFVIGYLTAAIGEADSFQYDSYNYNYIVLAYMIIKHNGFMPLSIVGEVDNAIAAAVSLVDEELPVENREERVKCLMQFKQRLHQYIADQPEE